MNNINENIIGCLRTINPYTVYLFGSYAKGNPDKNSDIDLMIVLNTNESPRSFNERMDITLQVRNCLEELNKEYAFDLIVYTKNEFEYLKSINFSSIRQILKEGKVLI